jgi:hypothetical protein
VPKVRRFNARTSGGAVNVLGLWLIALLVGGSTGRNVEPGDRDWPVVNPTPTRFLYLHGTINPSLDIRFRILWRARNADCYWAASWIEGAFPPYTAWNPLDITRNGQQFHVRIPLDGVLPGRCQWAFDGLKFSGPTGFTTTLVATNSYPLRPGQSPDGIATLSCGWKTEPGNVEGERGIRCRWPKDEDENASVLGGVLWWHPEARDFEVHFAAEKERN